MDLAGKYLCTRSQKLATCSKKRKDEDEIKDCQDAIRKKFLGPKPVFGVAPPKEPEDFAKKETVLKTDDPKLLKRVLQIYASKRESLNLLKSELNLVQGLAKLLTGEALEDELEVKIESAAKVEVVVQHLHYNDEGENNVSEENIFQQQMNKIMQQRSNMLGVYFT